jgi:hypothetical protein
MRNCKIALLAAFGTALALPAAAQVVYQAAPATTAVTAPAPSRANQRLQLQQLQLFIYEVHRRERLHGRDDPRLRLPHDSWQLLLNGQPERASVALGILRPLIEVCPLVRPTRR